MPTRVANLIATERKKVTRFVPDVPVYDVQAGNGTDQIPLRKLNNHLMKLPRNLKAPQVMEVNRRLKVPTKVSKLIRDPKAIAKLDPETRTAVVHGLASGIRTLYLVLVPVMLVIFVVALLLREIPLANASPSQEPVHA